MTNIVARLQAQIITFSFIHDNVISRDNYRKWAATAIVQARRNEEHPYSNFQCVTRDVVKGVGLPPGSSTLSASLISMDKTNYTHVSSTTSRFDCDNLYFWQQFLTPPAETNAATEIARITHKSDSGALVHINNTSTNKSCIATFANGIHGELSKSESNIVENFVDTVLIPFCKSP